MNPRSPFMTLHEVADYVRLESTKNPLTNAHKWVKRHQVPTFDRGRVLVLKADVDEALRDGAKARRRRSA